MTLTKFYDFNYDTHEKMFYKLQETTDTNLDYYIQQNYQ